MLTIVKNNAAQIKSWIETRKGVAIWRSIDLSNPNKEILTPADITTKPHWSVANSPAEIVTSLSDISVIIPKEIRRFHVAIRRASNNPFVTKLTDSSSAKVRNAIAKVPDSYYEFDYYSQEAVIYAPAETIPLTEWKE